MSEIILAAVALNQDLADQAIEPAAVEYCHCGAIGDAGHTFGCIMEQTLRKRGRAERAISDDDRATDLQFTEDGDYSGTF